MPHHPRGQTAPEQPAAKTCVRCGVLHPISEFPTLRTRKGTLSVKRECKTCRKDYMRRYYVANKKQWKEKTTSWRLRTEYNARRRERYHSDEAFREDVCAKAREWRKKHPDRALASDLRDGYGMTLEEYSRLLSSQGGRCAICGDDGRGKAKKAKRLHVDHDHKTGVIRGLLCSPCNFAIGLLRDNPELLRRAASYLAEASASKEPCHAS